MTEPRPRAAAGGGLLDHLFAFVDASSLGAFRLLFGALMVSEALSYFRRDRIALFFVEPRFLFTYDPLPFLSPWPGIWLYLHFGLMALAAAGLALGLFYRFSAVLFLLTYAYVFLLDKALYNNHFYLIVLLSFLLALVDGDRWAALDLWRRPRPQVVPRWHLWLLRAQVVIVFVYAGVAKLNPDWLAGEPMATWLSAKANTPVIGSWLTTRTAAFWFSYAGLAFDLAVGFLLLWRRAVPWAIGGLVVFNLLNHWLFDIGVFPFLMMATTVLFAAPEWPRRVLAGLGIGSTRALEVPPARSSGARGPVIAVIVVYLAVQLVLPMRHWLYAGDVGWTEEGYRFSWLMKLRTKNGYARFWITDPASGQTWEATPDMDLNAVQRRRLPLSPDLIRQYAGFLRDEQERQGRAGVEVRVESLVSLNRRPPQPLIDPKVDVAAAVTPPLAAASGIVPLNEHGRPGAMSLDDYRALGRP